MSVIGTFCMEIEEIMGLKRNLETVDNYDWFGGWIAIESGIVTRLKCYPVSRT
jgi:hypothetical protein